jgi:lycopene cyclase domain-containing protein
MIPIIWTKQMSKYEYTLILLFWLIVSAGTHYRFRLQLYKSTKQMIVTVSLFFVIGLIWDMFGIIRGHWFFQYENLSGIRLGVLPVEELLFFLIVPYAILVFYNLLDLKIN